VLGLPEHAADTSPRGRLTAHGGGQHKKAPGLVARAHRYVTACGFAVAAIDAPGHGDRPRTEQDEWSVADIRKRVAAGEPLGPQIARYNAALAARAVPEWQAALDALQEVDCVGAGGPVGFWGVSMGSGIGVPLDRELKSPRRFEVQRGGRGRRGVADGRPSAADVLVAGPVGHSLMLVEQR